jgi:peptidoglycan hydrolase-like protein with peptidoglycan-binding domain
MASVFLNYRREDSSGYAGRIFDRLVARFGKTQIFRDIDRIEPGLDFTEVIDQSLKSCVAVLVLIGPKWLELRNDQGERRLDEPVDYVRFEIEQALERGVRVIPVLIPGMGHIPTEEELPESIRRLTRLHAFRLTEESWDAELNRLADLLQKLGLKPVPPRPDPAPRNSWIGKALMGLGVLFLIGLVASLWEIDTWDQPELLPDPPFGVMPMPPQPPIQPPGQPQPASRDDILRAQRELAELGFYDGLADGINGPQTLAAVRDFQLSEGLTVDGRISAALLARLNGMLSADGGGTGVAGGGLSGTWYDNYLNRYEIVQSGNQVSASAYTASGEYLGEFDGILNGNRLDYSYETVLGTAGSGVGTLQADRQHMDTLASDYGTGISEANQLHRGHLPSSGY